MTKFCHISSQCTIYNSHIQQMAASSSFNPEPVVLSLKQLAILTYKKE